MWPSSSRAGHGPLAGLPFSDEVDAVLRWAFANDRHIISICHGPGAFLACAQDGKDNDFPFKGYSIMAFPDATDRETPEIGYMPGHLAWHFGEKLKALGVTILNTEPTGAVHADRKLLTGDSPFAGNALGKLAAENAPGRGRRDLGQCRRRNLRRLLRRSA